MQLSSIYLHSNRHVHLILKSYFLSFYMLIGSRDLASESIDVFKANQHARLNSRGQGSYLTTSMWDVQKVWLLLHTHIVYIPIVGKGRCSITLRFNTCKLERVHVLAKSKIGQSTKWTLVQQKFKKKTKHLVFTNISEQACFLHGLQLYFIHEV